MRGASPLCIEHDATVLSMYTLSSEVQLTALVDTPYVQLVCSSPSTAAEAHLYVYV